MRIPRSITALAWVVLAAVSLWEILHARPAPHPDRCGPVIGQAAWIAGHTILREPHAHCTRYIFMAIHGHPHEDIYTKVQEKPRGIAPYAGLFGLSGSYATIWSGYDGEGGLVDWRTPVADEDFMLPWGIQEYARLPGPSAYAYCISRVAYIAGSGWFMTLTTPNGGRFAFLHLFGVYHWSGCWLGGTIMGLTGWPSDPRYANGFPGPGDAHLCIVSDFLGYQWQVALANGWLTPRPTPRPKPRPPVFPAAAWHAKYRNIPFLYKGRITTIARQWAFNRYAFGRPGTIRAACGPPVTREMWRRLARVTQQNFAHCAVWQWPDRHATTHWYRG